MMSPDPAALREHRHRPMNKNQLTAKCQDVRGGNTCVSLTNSIFRGQLHVVRVEELQEGAVHRVGELVDFNHLLRVLVPMGLKHGSEVFTPAEHVV